MPTTSDDGGTVVEVVGAGPDVEGEAAVGLDAATDSGVGRARPVQLPPMNRAMVPADSDGSASTSAPPATQAATVRAWIST